MNVYVRSSNVLPYCAVLMASLTGTFWLVFKTGLFFNLSLSALVNSHGVSFVEMLYRNRKTQLLLGLLGNLQRYSACLVPLYCVLTPNLFIILLGASKHVILQSVYLGYVYQIPPCVSHSSALFENCEPPTQSCFIVLQRECFV